jgi:hypothetical protein
MQASILKYSEIAAVGIMAFALGGTVSALELNACQQTDPPADFVDITGASVVCEPEKQMCCEIDDGVGFCDAVSPPLEGFPLGKKFRVHSEVLPSGEVHWWADMNPAYTNTLPDGKKTIGASGGSNCFYGYEPDRDETSGAGYVKNNGTFSGVQRVIFFSDGVNENEVAALPPVPNCEFGPGGSGNVADVAVTCPTPTSGADGALERWIIVAEVRDENGNKNLDTQLGFIDPLTGDIDPTNFCKCNKGDNDAGQDENCNPNIQPGDPLATEGEYAGVPACQLVEALTTPVVIEIQNPLCIGSGSSRRCY